MDRSSSDGNGSSDPVWTMIPADVRATIPRTSIDDDPEVPADTAYVALRSELGIHLLALGYADPDDEHRYFALTVNREEPSGEWGDIDLVHLLDGGVTLRPVAGWTPRPMNDARTWAQDELGL